LLAHGSAGEPVEQGETSAANCVVKVGKPKRWNCGPEFQHSAILAVQHLIDKFQKWGVDLSGLLGRHLPAKLPAPVAFACAGASKFVVIGAATQQGG